MANKNKIRYYNANSIATNISVLYNQLAVKLRIYVYLQYILLYSLTVWTRVVTTSTKSG